jgi:hypothetical protein
MLDIKQCAQSEIKKPQYPETSIQDQPIRAELLIETNKFEVSILCNYKFTNNQWPAIIAAKKGM